MDLNDLKESLKDKTITEKLSELANIFPGKTVFTTSFGIEDQVIIHLIAENRIPVEVSTLDTGRLFPQTYKVFNETLKKYNIDIKVFFPDHDPVERMVTEKGPFSFYYSRENRLECCRYRKVMPLQRILAGKSCWISGIRAGQSETRNMMNDLEFDNRKDLFTFYPLFNWSFPDIRDFVRSNNIPYNSLHDNGFVSIGCEPCTRAIKDGEDFRAGRWWWENGNEKECGLHIR